MYLSLVDICLDTIVENFPRFNSVFISTTDESMKRRFEFLQRKYSFDLVSRVTAKEDIQEEQVDLLINKYLKVLDTVWLKNCSWAKIISKVAEIGPNVESFFVELQYPSETDPLPWREVIFYLPNLKSIICQSLDYDLIIENVANCCRNIEEIVIKNCEGNFRSVKYLCKNENREALCTKLKRLNIGSLYVSHNNIKYLLKNLPSLEVFDYPALPVVLHEMHKKDFSSANVKTYNITKLDVWPFSSIHAHILLICASVCPHLKSLRCSLNNKHELSFISKLSELEELDMENWSNPRTSVDEVLKCIGEKLTSLKVSHFTLSLSKLSENCPCIEELKLNGTRLLLDNDAKKSFNSLSHLTFENCNIYEYAEAVDLLLSSSRKLESLAFEGCNLLSSGVKAQILKCCALCSIKKISFSGSVIDIDLIKEVLTNCLTLNYLNIVGFLNKDQEDEIIKLGEILPNNPKIDIGNSMDISDSEESENDFPVYDVDTDDSDAIDYTLAYERDWDDLRNDDISGPVYWDNFKK